MMMVGKDEQVLFDMSGASMDGEGFCTLFGDEDEEEDIVPP